MGDEEESLLYFNGVDATSGTYLVDPVSEAALARALQSGASDPIGASREHDAELRLRAARQDEAHFGVQEGVDPGRIEQAGWGVLLPAVAADSAEEREQESIVEALAPLLRLRRAQATSVDERRYREIRGPLGYRQGETKQRLLSRLGAGPGPVDPSKVPYYLLIVGSPEQIPFHVQYQLDVQYAVGRLYFDTAVEYADYARSVVAVETGAVQLARDVAFIGVANPGDRATLLSRERLVEPLAALADGWSDTPGWRVSRYFDDDANKATVSRLFGGHSTPALLFSASHGVGFPQGDPLQRRHQGALLLQDWEGPGSGKVGADLYLSADDLRGDVGPLGLIALNYACYSGGTPEHDEFPTARHKRRRIAASPFVARLHQRLLGHPKGGALAAIGHVERAWGCSFTWGPGQAAQLAVFESVLKALMRGATVGMAVEYFNQRYAELAADLSERLEALDFDPGAIDEKTISMMWTSSNDARGYAVTGDPAVRLRFTEPVGSSGVITTTTTPELFTAAERPRMRINVSSVIDARVSEVWARIRDFNGLPSWHPLIVDSEIEGGGPSDRVGCVRAFHTRDGGLIRERLLGLSDDERRCVYEILESPMGVRRYVAILRLSRVTDGDRTFAEWSAEFECDPGRERELSERIGQGVFQAGFDALKQMSGSRFF
jgi:hypothetical protein